MKIQHNPGTGNTSYELEGVGGFEMPPIPESAEHSAPVAYFHAAVHNFSESASKVTEVEKNDNLSPAGKGREGYAHRVEAVKAVARLDVFLDSQVAMAAKLEGELFALPAIDQSHSVAAIEAREIRDWYRGLSVKEQTAVMYKMQEEPGNDRLILAFLRSPIPGFDVPATIAQDVWKKTRRLDNPGKAIEIDTIRRNVEWARKGTNQLAQIAYRATKLDQDYISSVLLLPDQSGGDKDLRKAAKAFGIDAMFMARTEAKIQRDLAKAKARETPTPGVAPRPQ